MRIDKIREGLKEEGIGGIVVSNIKNVRYISGFTGEEGMAVVTENNAYLIVDGRFTEQAESESEIEVVDFGKNFVKTIANLLEKDKVKKCAFEGNHMTYSEASHMIETINSVEWKPLKDLFEKVRMIKDKSDEYKKILYEKLYKYIDQEIVVCNYLINRYNLKDYVKNYIYNMKNIDIDSSIKYDNGKLIFEDKNIL